MDQGVPKKIVALAGGVGGAKLAHGLAMALPSAALTVIVNTGDDFEHLGLRISPDLDTVCYTLAGLANAVTGWGRAEETWNAIRSLGALGGPTWFNLGDQDLGTHLERTRRLASGEPLSTITHDFCRAWGVAPRVLPMTDDAVSTWVDTQEDGWLPFQEYFVHRLCGPRVRGFRFEGAGQARPAPGVLEALDEAEYVIICPSNPWVSIGPIRAIDGMDDALRQKTVVAVSPIVGGQAIKGPAAKMYSELGIAPSALAVAEQYGDLLSGFVLDTIDQDMGDIIAERGLRILVTNTIMKSNEDRQRLAVEIIKFCGTLNGKVFPL